MRPDSRLSRMLHVLLHMARHDGPMTSEAIARMLGTNPVVVRRTMAGLRKAGYVRSEKGHGGGWRLTRPLGQITLLTVYEALGRPNLFAVGNRSRNPDCLVEKNVNAVLVDTMTEAAALFIKRFGEITLDQIVPSPPVSLSVHAKA